MRAAQAVEAQQQKARLAKKGLAPKAFPRVALDLATTVERIQQNFVISDPSIPDCPIVFASEGFLDMIGYPRAEVLGRNCRFLQVGRLGAPVPSVALTGRLPAGLLLHTAAHTAARPAAGSGFHAHHASLLPGGRPARGTLLRSSAPAAVLLTSRCGLCCRWRASDRAAGHAAQQPAGGAKLCLSPGWSRRQGPAGLHVLQSMPKMPGAGQVQRWAVSLHRQRAV